MLAEQYRGVTVDLSFCFVVEAWGFDAIVVLRKNGTVLVQDRRPLASTYRPPIEHPSWLVVLSSQLHSDRSEELRCQFEMKTETLPHPMRPSMAEQLLPYLN